MVRVRVRVCHLHLLLCHPDLLRSLLLLLRLLVGRRPRLVRVRGRVRVRVEWRVVMVRARVRVEG